jgi:MvaI/BcnI restriction endonuclease family
MNYDEFMVKLRQLSESGYVATHRPGDTGVGKTLEDLVGIAENNIAGPDFEIYELKAARKDSNSMLTLFTKSPEPQGANSLLLSIFGYARRDNEAHLVTQLPPDPAGLPASLPTADSDKELHVTVEYGRENSVGLKLAFDSRKLIIDNDRGVPAYYTQEYLRKAFEAKYGHKLIYVLADRRKPAGQREEFWYSEAWLLAGFGFEGFVNLVKSRIVRLDIRMGHFSDGRPHDHGTGFRVFPKDLPKCFSAVVRIL